MPVSKKDGCAAKRLVLRRIPFLLFTVIGFPVSMFKMLLVGYLYDIKSERRLVQEIQLNIAYRWFCGFELGEKIPDHSTFSKTRVRKWNESSLFPQIFLEIVRCCMEQKLIDGKEMASAGSYIPA